MTLPPPKTLLLNGGRVAVTLILVIAALFAGRSLWTHYQVDPWTRDGRVRADIIQVAPDVTGLVTEVAVTNDQPVRRGQLLFRVDPARYGLAERQAEAAVQAQRTLLAQARREAARNRALGDLVAGEVTEQGQAKVDQADAALAQAVSARDLARLNLARTEVRAPADGYLSDLVLRAGDYVAAGKPVLALIDATSFRVDGYFEETKLHDVAIGAPVSVRIMGEPAVLRGHVQSISHGVEDRDRTTGGNLLPTVNPTFNWVRLAQRVPVRIVLDRVPDNVRLIAGRTATVSILGPDGRPRHGGAGVAR